MSVINRVLRQLDARAAGPKAVVPEAGKTTTAWPLPGSTAAGLPPGVRAGTSRWRLPVIVLLGGGVIGAAALADLSPWQTQRTVAVPLAGLGPSTAVEAPGAAVPAPAPALAPAPESASAPAEPPQAALQAQTPQPQPVALPRRPATLRPTAAPAPPVAPPAASPSPPPLTTAQPMPAALSAAWPQPGPALPRIDKRALPGTAAERAALAHRDAMDLARLGQNQAALQRALQAVAQDPAHAAARQLAAVLQHEAGASDSALALLREGAALPAPPAALTLLLARLLATQGLDAEALSWLDRKGLHSGEAEGLRAGLLAQRGQYALALPAYESAVQQQPGNPMWWFGLAVALESEGQGARARQAFAQARQLRLPREDLDTYAEQRLRALP